MKLKTRYCWIINLLSCLVITVGELYAENIPLSVTEQNNSELGVIAPGTRKDIAFKTYVFNISGEADKQVRITASINSVYNGVAYTASLNNCRWYLITVNGDRSEINSTNINGIVSINNALTYKLENNNLGKGILSIEIVPESISLDRNARANDSMVFPITLSVEYVN